MVNDNVQLIRGAYDAFAHGDVPTVLGMFSDGITWHVPGRSPLSASWPHPSPPIARSLGVCPSSLASKFREKRA